MELRDNREFPSSSSIEETDSFLETFPGLLAKDLERPPLERLPEIEKEQGQKEALGDNITDSLSPSDSLASTPSSTPFFDAAKEVSEVLQEAKKSGQDININLEQKLVRILEKMVSKDTTATEEVKKAVIETAKSNIEE
jgi:uncharacterized protein (DUF2267 family)